MKTVTTYDPFSADSGGKRIKNRWKQKRTIAQGFIRKLWLLKQLNNDNIQNETGQSGFILETSAFITLSSTYSSGSVQMATRVSRPVKSSKAG